MFPGMQPCLAAFASFGRLSPAAFWGWAVCVCAVSVLLVFASRRAERTTWGQWILLSPAWAALASTFVALGVCAGHPTAQTSDFAVNALWGFSWIVLSVACLVSAVVAAAWAMLVVRREGRSLRRAGGMLLVAATDAFSLARLFANFPSA